MTKKRRLTKKTIDDKLKKLSLVFSFEGVRKRIKGSIIILDSSMAEHPAVNRRVAGSSPARGVFYGPLVKGLRHRPFTAVTRVRIPHGSFEISGDDALRGHTRSHSEHDG